MRMLLLISALLSYSLAWSQDETMSDEVLDAADTEELDIGEEPLELEEVVVTAERFTLEQETALRMVRQALKEKRTYSMKDKDKWVCWYRKPTGTRMTHLECGRNGDLIALQPDIIAGQLLNTGSRMPGYGTIMRSRRPVNKKKFEAMLNSLPGSDDFDREFVSMQLAGGDPPRDVPSPAELDAFTEAYKVVNDMSEENEAAMIQAIEMQGMTLNRYNRIVQLVETYQSIENEVAYRLGTLERPEDD